MKQTFFALCLKLILGWISSMVTWSAVKVTFYLQLIIVTSFVLKNTLVHVTDSYSTLEIGTIC